MSIFNGPQGGVIAGILLYVICVAIGAVGFSIIEGWTLNESLYMTIISITTVGFNEVHPLSADGRMFASFIILFGLGTVFYTTTMLGKVILESEFRGTIERRQMKHKIDKLTNHIIVCGYGRTGRIVTEALHDDGVGFCVVENNRELEGTLHDIGYLYLMGDATEESVLREAGIERARAVLSLLSSDADNLYLTIAARELNQRIKVVSRALDETAEKRLRRGGAHHVVATYRIAGQRVLQAAVRPTVSEFFDLVHDRGQLSLIMEENTVSEGSSLIGKSLEQTQVRSQYGVIVIAIKKASGEMLFNPEANVVLSKGDILIAVGEDGGLKRLEGDCRQKHGRD